MPKLLSLTTGLAMLLCFSLIASTIASANGTTNPAEPAAPAQDGTMPALTAIAGQGMMSNEAYNDLEELSDYIGGRVTGSPEAGQAIQWGIQKMQAMGLENVRAKNGKSRAAGPAFPPARNCLFLSIATSPSIPWVGLALPNKAVKKPTWCR
jgi:hypothetical protein